MTNTTRQCPRCGTDNAHRDAAGKVVHQCTSCGTPLRAKRFHMNRKRVKWVHVFFLSRKGLTYGDYKRRLRAVGVDTCLDLKRDQYYRLFKEGRKLPDSPRWQQRERRIAA